MSERRTPWSWVVVVVTAAAIAHSCGYLFGVSNQFTYFLDPLQRVHPELFHHDWLVTRTTLYHSVFSAAASYLFVWDDSGAVSAAIAHALLMTALVIGVYVVLTGATERGAGALFVVIAAWLTIDGDRSLAGSYLWSGYLQPSLIASLGWVFALATYVRGRPLATGVVLAVSGLFHVNFLLLGIGMFALAEIASDRRDLVRRLALLLAPQLVALALLAPDLFASAGGGSDPKLALWILVRYHAPVHYFPFRVRHSLPVLVRWVALAIVVAPLAIAHGRDLAVRRLVTWCWIAGGLCALAVPVLMIPPLMPLTRLYVWRLGPFAQLAGMFVIALAVAATIEDPSRWRAQPMWRRVAAIALAAWTIWETPSDPGAQGGWALAITALGIVVAIVAPRVRARLAVAVAVASLAVVLGARWPTIAHPQVEVASSGADTDALFEWARTSTPVDAQFMTPPDLEPFRFLARRAIVADFKSPPLLPDELVEWYRRLGRVTGEPALHDVPQTRQLWADSTGEQLLARARDLGTQYLVLDRTAAQANLPRAPVYANPTFVVYATSP